MTDDYIITKDVPRDDDGHPIHPERGHRICGASKSDRTTPTKHGRERDDVDYCLLAAGWGVDDKREGPCKHHLGAVDNRGENNPNYKHGAYSEHLKSDLSEREREAFDYLVGVLEDPEQAIAAMRELGAEAVLRYKRSADPRFLKEARQVFATFNVVEATDSLEVAHSGAVDHEHTLDDETEESILELIRGRQQEDAAGDD